MKAGKFRFKLSKILTIAGMVFIPLLLYMTVTAVQTMAVSEGRPIPEYGDGKAALLILDVQEGTTGVLSSSENLRKQSESLIKILNSLIGKSETLGMPVIYLRREAANRLLQLIKRGIPVAGSPAASMDRRLLIASDNILSVGAMDGFANPALDSLLCRQRVSHLYLAGLDAATSINRTCRAALNRGYRVTLIRDAIISEKAARKDEYLQTLPPENLNIIQSKNLILALACAELR